MTTTELRQVMDVTARRDHLLALIRQAPHQLVTTGAVHSFYRATLQGGRLGRNAARRDLRDLAHRGQLIPRTVDGQRSYVLHPQAIHRIPMGPRLAKAALLKAVTEEGGEWTPGRAKSILHRAMGTNVYRSVARRCLEDLHRKGLLELRSERPGHCYYTLTEEGAAA